MGAETQISQLVLEVSAQTALAQRSLNDLARVVQSSTGQMNASLATVPTTMKKIEGSFTGLKSTITGLFAGLVVGGLEQSIQHSLAYAGSLAEVARTLGVTTKDLQTFRYAATQSGVAQDQLEVGLRRLTVSMGKAELGSKAQAKAFQAIGISIADLKGKDTGDVFRLMADGLSNVSDRSQRAAIEMTLMGRSGSTLDNLLAPGSKRLNDLADAAQRLGIVLSNEQIQHAEETAHKVEALKIVLSAQIAGVVANNAGAILGLVNALVRLTSTIGPAVQGWRTMVHEFNAFGGAIAQDIGAAFHGGTLVNPLHAMNQADRDLKTQDTWAMIRANSMDWGKKPSLGGDLPQIFGGGGGRGHHARVSKGPQDHTAEHDDSFNRELDQLNAEILAAKKSLTANYTQQADIAEQELEAETAAKLAAIKKEVDSKQITAAQGKELTAKQQALAAEKKAVIEQQRLVKSLEAEQQAQDQKFGFQAEDLKFADEMATTSKEHRSVQLAILDIQYQQKKVDLEILLKKQQMLHDLDGAAQTQAALDRLATEKSQDQQRVNQGTLDPLAQWAKSVPQTAGQIIEALQSIEVQGLDGLSSAIADVITGTKSLKQAFGDVAQSIISEIIQMTIKMLIFRALSSAFGGIFGGGAAGGPMSVDIGASSVFTNPAPLQARAIGGPVTSGSPYLVGENGPELFVPNGSGMIVPNKSRIGSPRAANNNSPGLVEVRIHTDENFHAEVAQVAGAIVVHAAPAIVRSAQKGTVKSLTRPAITGRR